MKYHELSGIERYGKDGMAGDLAEAKVAEVMAAMDRPVQDFGPRRVSTERAQHTTWSPVIRHAPDYLGWGRFIEVQGSDGHTVIFKHAKIEALTWWDTIMPVFFGIYLQSRDEVLFCDMPTVLWAISHEETEHFILDPETRNPKQAFRVPVPVLMERLTVDCFAASKSGKGA